MSCTNATCLTPTTGVASEIFTSALQFFAASQCLLDDTTLLDYSFVGDTDDYKDLDFIIVGSGSAGCVLANRLSEVKDWRVLLIEAGGEPSIESMIPRLSSNLFDSEYEWRFKSVNNRMTSQATKHGTVALPRGKMLGGSSNIYEMMYLRGSPSNYREWQQEGNQDWGPELVDHYFKKAESLQDQWMLKDPTISKTYGHNGPLVLNRFNSTYRELTKHILKSFDEIGSPWVSDLNTANLMGSGIYTATAANGVRQSANRDYLDPILAERKNLKIAKNTLVTKVLIDDFYNAYGVEAERDGKKVHYYAKREVILSAGPINSPQLLMLSGVGPVEELNEHGIPCIVNLPYVGKNLQSHNIVPVTIFGNGPPGMSNADDQYQAIEYLYNRKGHLAQSYLADILSFNSVSSNISNPEFMAAVEIIGNNSNNVGMILDRLVDSVKDSVYEQHKNHTLFSFHVTVQRPYSRGTIKLRSNNPKDYPIIDLKVFEDPRDLNLAVNGMKKLTKILDTKYFRSIDAYLGRLKWGPCDSLELNSDNYWKCICRNMVGIAEHPVGTCKMGPDPRTSVVDSRLRVHGVSNLRVAEESIMPTITTGSTAGPIVMIGERAADIIKEDNRMPEYRQRIISENIFTDDMPYFINEPYSEEDVVIGDEAFRWKHFP